MIKLQQLILDHLARCGDSARSLAGRTCVGYPAILALVKEGRLPRKPEHQESLRVALGIDPQTWAGMLAEDRKLQAGVPTDGPLTLQQLVLKAMIEKGHDHGSFAKASGIPYPTLINLITNGAVPRRATLERLAEALALDPELIRQAISLTHNNKSRSESDNPTSAATQESTVPSYDNSTPSLAQLASDAIVKSGASVASFARENNIPYVSLMRLMNSGQPPRRKAVLDPLEKVLGVPHDQFVSSLEKSKANPTPAEAPKLADKAVNSFHARLLQLVEEKAFTTKAFAEAADISVLTAAKLLKRGDLPGRQTTHEKLRNLMGLSKEDYFALLESARPVDEPEESSPSSTTPGYVTVASGAAPVATTKGELFELIDRMSPSQLVALKQFLLSVL